MARKYIADSLILGSTIIPEVHGRLYKYGEGGQKIAACAIGSIFMAEKIGQNWMDEWYSLFPHEVTWSSWMMNCSFPSCPLCERAGFLRYLVVHLFEDHKLSRVEIAAKIFPIEVKLWEEYEAKLKEKENKEKIKTDVLEHVSRN